MRRLILGLMVCVFLIGMCGIAFVQCQEAQKVEKEVVFSGRVKEIAEDGSYIIVGNRKVITTQEFLNYYLPAEGDEVEITARHTPKGLEAVGCDFMLDATENIEEYIQDTKAVDKDE